MTWSNEEKSQNGESKKSELLPTGERVKEIIEVLTAMYRAIQNPEDATNDEKSEHANR